MIYENPPTCQIPGLDEIYQKYFGEKQGTFVDIGAFDGEKYSNTWSLAKAGWYGLCIEPNPTYFTRLQDLYQNNPKIQCVQAIIGKAEHYHLHLNGAYTTILPEQEEIYRKIAWNSGESGIIEMEGVTLDMQLELSNIPIGFEVLSVDVEGAELDVLSGFTLLKWLPFMVIIEASENHPIPEMGRHAEEINAYFVNKYNMIYSDVINNIYVAREDALREFIKLSDTRVS